MGDKLNIHYFAHSWVSDWNHGSAHFLRGLAKSLIRLGHTVNCYEELGSWSLTNLVRQESDSAVVAIDEFRRQFPELNVQFYCVNEELSDFFAEQLRDANIVILHEWMDPVVVNTVLSLKAKLGFKALFHDTHHRAYSSPRDILAFRLDQFDGVLAYGEAIRKIYSDGFGISRTWTFHEAADVDHFSPRPSNQDIDLLWMGQWGSDERNEELREFLIEPASDLRAKRVVVYGAGYPQAALFQLQEAGIEFRGYVPNLSAPDVYHRSKLSLYIPQKEYSNGLASIPSIRVFESLACGTPLISSPWSDAEGLFKAGQDYLCVGNGQAMQERIKELLRDDKARKQLSEHGAETIRRRHTCMHRARELVAICEDLIE